MISEFGPVITKLRPDNEIEAFLITELRPLITELRPLITELRPLITELRPLITELRLDTGIEAWKGIMLIRVIIPSEDFKVRPNGP